MNHSPSPHEHNLGKGSLFLALFLFLVGILGFCPTLGTKYSQANAPAQSKIAVSANLVLLPVKVTDERGAFVSGLKMEDFRVIEGAQQQKLTVFEEGDTPVTVGLVVDHNRSMDTKISDVVAAVTVFAHSSNPQDEMFVVDFNDDVSIELMKGKAFSNDAKELEEALRAVSARGRTALYDAVSEGLHLRRPCQDTGGVPYFPRPGESAADVAKEIARDLREQYTIGYTPEDMKSADGFRKIEVKVIAPGRGKVRVRTRQAYLPAVVKQPIAQLEPEIR